jgi:hypothetical protein
MCNGGVLPHKPQKSDRLKIRDGRCFRKFGFCPVSLLNTYLYTHGIVDDLEPSRRPSDGLNGMCDVSEKSVFVLNGGYLWNNSIGSRRFGIGSTRRRWINRTLGLVTGDAFETSVFALYIPPP